MDMNALMSPPARDQHFLETKLQADFADKPQRLHEGLGALASVTDGLARLAALGYRYQLVETSGTHEPPKPQEYPKMLYRDMAPKELTVEDEVAEAEARDQGYHGMNEVQAQTQDPAKPATQTDPPTAKPATLAGAASASGTLGKP